MLEQLFKILKLEDSENSYIFNIRIRTILFHYRFLMTISRIHLTYMLGQLAKVRFCKIITQYMFNICVGTPIFDPIPSNAIPMYMFNICIRTPLLFLKTYFRNLKSILEL